MNVKRRKQGGFSMVELMIASAVLLFGVVAVVQLVPEAMRSNLRNRYDSSAVVIAERLLDQMLSQPITATQFTDADGRVILLGGAAGAQGNALQVVNTSVRIDFTAALVAGYNFRYVDPNEAAGTQYEVRWTVITQLQGATPASKRYIVGAWRRDPRFTSPPVTVEAWQQR